MSMHALEDIGAGFSQESLGSQQVFRAVLSALSRPGIAVDLNHDAEHPSQGHASSAGVLLALLDPDCRVWLSPSLIASTAPTWLRFHTGCEVVEDPGVANFLWFHSHDQLLDFNLLMQGSDSYPDQSATVILDLANPDQPQRGEGLAADHQHVSLSGPGIPTRVDLDLSRIPLTSREVLLTGLTANAERFPRGVDVLLAEPCKIIGLTRSTIVQIEQRG